VSNLGKNLRAARKKLGLTQEEVAERSGVQAGEVSRIEPGKRDPRVSILESSLALSRCHPAGCWTKRPSSYGARSVARQPEMERSKSRRS
jgi:transcriptional regulator with XRE-family HTH domain